MNEKNNKKMTLVPKILSKKLPELRAETDEQKTEMKIAFHTIFVAMAKVLSARIDSGKNVFSIREIVKEAQREIEAQQALGNNFDT